MQREGINTSTTAAVGFGNGAGDAPVLAGSNQPGMYQTPDSQDIWFNANLTPVEPGTAPESTSLARLLTGLVGRHRMRRRG